MERVENKYTFDGDFSYQEIINSLAIKTNRSVLGYTLGLEIKRNFKIVDKAFSVAIDHVNKNLYTDGYKLEYDSSCFYLLKLDSLKTDDKEKYSIYLQYAKKWIITEDKMIFLNAKQEDYDKHLKDSLIIELSNKKILDSLNRTIEKRKIYKCDFHIIGYTVDKNKLDGFDIENMLSAKISLTKQNYIPDIAINIKANAQKSDSKLNFDRKITTYLYGDSTQSLVFGSEIRQVNSVINTNNTVQTSYESVFDGLTIALSKQKYYLKYKIGSNEINLTGIPDSVSIGSSSIDQVVKKKNLFIFNSKNDQNNEFYLTAKMIVKEVIQ